MTTNAAAQTGNWEAAVDWLAAQPDMAGPLADAYLDRPLRGAAKRYHASSEWKALQQWLPPAGGRLLDLGAGNGILAYAAAVDGWTVTAIEPDPSAVVGAAAIRRLAAETDVTIEVLEAFGETLPLADGSIDVAFARQVLHHARDLPALCSELARVTVPGGLVIALRDHVISGPSQLQPFLDAHLLHHRYGGENAYTLAQYRGALAKAGLTVVRALSSFASPVNYGPQSETAIRDAVAARVSRLPGAAALVRTLPFPLLTKALSTVDRRPGRLWSFICRKPVRAR